MRRFALASLILSSLAACGGELPPPPPVSAAPPSTPPVAPPVAPSPREAECATAEACHKVAEGKLAEKNLPGAREALTRSCHLKSTLSCVEGGELWLTEPADKTRAAALLAHACSESTKDADACAHLARLQSKSGEADPRAVLATAEAGCKPGGATPERKKVRGDACVLLGEAHTLGRGTSVDPRKALAAYEEACKLGNDEGCKAQKALAKPEIIPGANLHVEQMSGNGMSLKDIACKTDGMAGMFGAMALVASFSPKKAQLDACSPKKKSEVTVFWTNKNSTMTDIHAKGPDAAQNKCVERALTGSKVAMPGTCAATVLIGK